MTRSSMAPMADRTTRLLVPVDRSLTALRALPPAVRLAERLGVPLEMFTWADSAEEGRAAERSATEALQQLGVTATVTASVTDDPGPAGPIAAAAAASGATIVMSTHGRSGFGQAVLGSVAEEVLRLVAEPIVLVGPQVEEWTGRGLLLVCLDGSDRAEAAIPPARAWAQQLGLVPQVVTVIEAGPRVPIPEAVLDGSYVAGAAERLAGREAGQPSDVAVLHGDAAAAIVAHATATDLVAVATHGRTGLQRTVLGSVAMKVVHRAPCPVLVVRAPDDHG